VFKNEKAEIGGHKVQLLVVNPSLLIFHVGFQIPDGAKLSLEHASIRRQNGDEATAKPKRGSKVKKRPSKVFFPVSQTNKKKKKE
jgi:hypothetical protein